ncbi:cell division protein SepF [Bacillus sp. AFS088145]|uniref:cell division protein SepF n=1 Tax=Bacillus sp. AFS088145 TaxID=2033514 RepID=UPI000BF3A12B|nr:cell division protein SepF [Bacillus sp. AFS088145]PFH89485.1 cell division protein SepF [Bacillus sp. AFS088145]
MSIIGKVRNFFAMEDEYEDDYEYEEQQQQQHQQQKQYQQQQQQFSKHVNEEINHERNASKQKLVSIPGGASLSSKVVLAQPREYAEAQDVADHLKSKKAVVINLQQMQIDQAKRFVDFLSGTVYAISGDIKKIGTNTFICTPDNIDISGTITDMLFEEDNSIKRW